MVENPYRSPCETTVGEYDYTLTFRVLRAVLVIVGAIAFVVLALLWQHHGQIGSVAKADSWQQVWAFFFDWMGTQKNG